MPKTRSLLPVMLIASVVHSAPALAEPATCDPGKPSVVIRVAGFKAAQGTIKVSLYGGDEKRWLAKKGRIARVKLPVTARSMDICMNVPAAGRYAVAVHHDMNVNGKRDASDGGGYSNNPKVSLLNPKPSFSKAAFTVGPGKAHVSVRLLYIRGLSVGPVTG